MLTKGDLTLMTFILTYIIKDTHLKCESPESSNRHSLFLKMLLAEIYYYYYVHCILPICKYTYMIVTDAIVAFMSQSSFHRNIVCVARSLEKIYSNPISIPQAKEARFLTKILFP